MTAPRKTCVCCSTNPTRKRGTSASLAHASGLSRSFVLAHIALAFLFPLVGCGGGEPPTHNGQPVAHWREALRSPNVAVRREAVTALGKLDDKEAVPALVVALTDKDAQLRSQSAQALWGIGVPEEHAKNAVPALAAMLNEKDAGARLNAVGALGQVKGEGGKIIPALKKGL